MGLIKCPECGKEVSDKSEICIHCGFPLENKNQCIINGKKYDLSEIQNMINNGIEDFTTINQKLQNLTFGAGLGLIDYSNLTKQITLNKSIPKEYISPKQPTVKIRCPKCGSTAISTGARGFNIWTGFIGSGKTVNRCASCGHTWQPRK